MMMILMDSTILFQVPNCLKVNKTTFFQENILENNTFHLIFEFLDFLKFWIFSNKLKIRIDPASGMHHLKPIITYFQKHVMVVQADSHFLLICVKPENNTYSFQQKKHIWPFFLHDDTLDFFLLIPIILIYYTINTNEVFGP